MGTESNKSKGSGLTKGRNTNPTKDLKYTNKDLIKRYALGVSSKKIEPIHCLFIQNNHGRSRLGNKSLLCKLSSIASCKLFKVNESAARL